MHVNEANNYGTAQNEFRQLWRFHFRYHSQTNQPNEQQHSTEKKITQNAFIFSIDNF